MRIISSVILRVCLCPILLSIISAETDPGYFMTRFPELNTFFTQFLKSNASHSPEKNPFKNLSEEECSKFFKTRVFVYNDSHIDDILNIKNVINKSTFYFEMKIITTANYSFLCYHCFSYKYFSFYLSPNYMCFNKDMLYYPHFAYYSHKPKNISAVFAYIEQNATVENTNVPKMERSLYKEVTNPIHSYLVAHEALVTMNSNQMLRTCSAAAKYVLPETSGMEVCKIQFKLLSSEERFQRPIVILRNDDNVYHFHQSLLHCHLDCLLTDEHHLENSFFIILHPIADYDGYIVEEIENTGTFRLKLYLANVQKK